MDDWLDIFCRQQTLRVTRFCDRYIAHAKKRATQRLRETYQAFEIESSGGKNYAQGPRKSGLGE